jgi:hypothetical protein
MGFATGGAHLSDRWNLWWIHHVLNILTRQLLFDGEGEAMVAGAYMIGSVILSLGALIVAMQVVRALPN